MKQLVSYIIEKLQLNNNSKSKVINIDKENTKLMIAIIKSIYISIYKNRTYKIRGLAQYSIKRSEIDWEDIYNILSEEYNFTLNKHDILLPAPIKEIGKISVNIRLHPEVIAKVNIDVVEEKIKAKA